MKMFEGIFAVMPTAYNDQGNIDRKVMSQLADYLIRSGIHGLVVLGSNGECPYLTHRHQKDAIDAVVEACSQRIPVIVGINDRGAEPALEMARYAEAAEANGLLLALPLFYRIEEDAVYGFFSKICCDVDIPVLYYNFPSATSLVMSPESIARVCEIDNIVGAKETVADIEEIEGLVKAMDEDFCVFSGMTLNLFDAMSVGACGAICPLPNIIPRKTVELYEAFRLGDKDRAQALQIEVLAYAPLLALTPTPHAMLKEALRLLGIPINVAVKNPLPQLTPAQAKTVMETLESTGLI
jgi:dihydrodipicolinate synthase/N-acetylneuraminate lyase